MPRFKNLQGEIIDHGISATASALNIATVRLQASPARACGSRAPGRELPASSAEQGEQAGDIDQQYPGQPLNFLTGIRRAVTEQEERDDPQCDAQARTVEPCLRMMFIMAGTSMHTNPFHGASR